MAASVKPKLSCRLSTSAWMRLALAAVTFIRRSSSEPMVTSRRVRNSCSTSIILPRPVVFSRLQAESLTDTMLAQAFTGLSRNRKCTWAHVPRPAHGRAPCLWLHDCEPCPIAGLEGYLDAKSRIE